MIFPGVYSDFHIVSYTIPYWTQILNLEFATVADRGEKCEHLYKLESPVAKGNC